MRRASVLSGRVFQPIAYLASPVLAFFTIFLASRWENAWISMVAVFLGITIFLANLAYPFLGTQLIMASLFVTLPLIGNSFGGMAFANIRAAQVISLISLIVFLARRSVYRIYQPPARIIGPFAVWITCMLLSIANSDYIDDSIRHMIKIICAQSVIFFVIVATTHKRWQIERIVRLLAIAAIIVCWTGVIQVLAFEYLQLDLFTTPWSFKPTGLFTESVWYGIYPSVLFALFFPLSFSKDFVPMRKLLYLAQAHCVAAMALSQNRGAAISTAVTTVLALTVFSTSSRELVQTRVQKILLIVAVMILPALIIERMWPDSTELLIDKIANSGLDDSSLARLNRFDAEFDAIQEHPIIGNGVGTWGRKIFAGMAESSDSYIVTETVRGGSSFNIFVGALYDAGILGFFSLLWLLASIALLLWRQYWTSQVDWDRSILAASLLSFSAVILNSQFNPLYQTDLAFAICGIAIAASNTVILNSRQMSFQ